MTLRELFSIRFIASEAGARSTMALRILMAGFMLVILIGTVIEIIRKWLFG